MSSRLDGIVMHRDQVIGFLEWLLDNDNERFQRVTVHLPPSSGEFTPERARSAIENWRTNKPDAVLRVHLTFESDVDAVEFKMKFVG